MGAVPWPPCPPFPGNTHTGTFFSHIALGARWSFWSWEASVTLKQMNGTIIPPKPPLFPPLQLGTARPGGQHRHPLGLTPSCAVPLCWCTRGAQPGQGYLLASNTSHAGSLAEKQSGPCWVLPTVPRAGTGAGRSGPPPTGSITYRLARWSGIALQRDGCHWRSLPQQPPATLLGLRFGLTFSPRGPAGPGSPCGEKRDLRSWRCLGTRTWVTAAPCSRAPGPQHGGHCPNSPLCPTALGARGLPPHPGGEEEEEGVTPRQGGCFRAGQGLPQHG